MDKQQLGEIFAEDDFLGDALLWGIKYAKYLKQVRTKHLRANYANEKKTMNRLLGIFRDIRQDVRLGMNMYEVHTKYDQEVQDAVNSGVFQSVTSGTAYAGDILERFIEYSQRHAERAKSLTDEYLADFWIIADELWSYHQQTGKVIYLEEEDLEEIPIRDLENPQKLDFRTRVRLVAIGETWDAFNEGVVISVMTLPEVEQRVMFLTMKDVFPNVCEDCLSHHGEVYDVSNILCRPQEDTHPNCRCILVPVGSEE